MEKIKNKYKNCIISRHTLKKVDIVDKIDIFLENREIYEKLNNEIEKKIRNKIKEFRHYEQKETNYGSLTNCIFDEIFNILQEIAPENCTFGFGEYNGTDLGFWEY